MEFRLIGDGPLFESTVASLRKFKTYASNSGSSNMTDLSSPQSTEFSVPNAVDSHGVSRDEAMSSGSCR
jgi:hypothetical protein